jgi:hypothetical protein
MTILRSIAAPSLALRHPCCPIYPRRPYLPKRAKGAGLGGQRLCWSTPSGPMAAPRDRIELAGPMCAMGAEGVGGWSHTGMVNLTSLHQHGCNQTFVLIGHGPLGRQHPLRWPRA